MFSNLLYMIVYSVIYIIISVMYTTNKHKLDRYSRV